MASEARNELELQWAETRMIRWMCGIKLRDRFICCELRPRDYEWLIELQWCSDRGYDDMGIF